MSLVGSLSSSYVDSIIPISGNVIISNTHDGQFPGWPGADIGFFVSGAISSIGGVDRTSSLFGGDLVVSGNVGLKRNLNIDGDMTVLGTLTTINSVNLEVYDSVVGFGFSSGTIARPAGDRGWIGGISGGDNVGLLWKESAGEFVVIKTESSATGTLDVKSYANFHAARGTFTELTGSLTRLSDGSPFIVAMSSSMMAQTGGISISTGSLGQITASYYVFANDLRVSLSNGKRFGRYGDGDTIPSTGKTPAEVIKMAIVEPITPLVSISSPTTVYLNQPNPSITVNYSHTIKSLDAGVSSAVLQWNRAGVVGGTNGTWVTIANQTSNTGTWGHVHTIIDISTNNTNPIYYRYVVTDTVGATATASVTITPVYAAPTVNSFILNRIGTGLSIPDSTSTVREIGNVGSELVFTITKNAPYVALTNYSLEYRAYDGSTWTSWTALAGMPVSISDSTPVSRQHTPSQLSSYTIEYRVVITDGYQTTTIDLTSISFYYVVFYGPSASAPSDSTGVRALPNTKFVNPGTGTYPDFSFNAGIAHKNFTVAVPNTHKVDKIIDYTHLGADLGPDPGAGKYHLSMFNVNSNDIVATTYKVYVLTTDLTYPDDPTTHIVSWSLA